MCSFGRHIGTPAAPVRWFQVRIRLDRRGQNHTEDLATALMHLLLLHPLQPGGREHLGELFRCEAQVAVAQSGQYPFLLMWRQVHHHQAPTRTKQPLGHGHAERRMGHVMQGLGKHGQVVTPVRLFQRLDAAHLEFHIVPALPFGPLASRRTSGNW